MTFLPCRYRSRNYCTLARAIAAQELSVMLPCEVTPETCVRCLANGEPSIASPSLVCLESVTRILPKHRLPEWSAFVTGVETGVRPQRKPAVARPVAPRQKLARSVCIHRGDAVETFDCGCKGGGKQHLYECDVAGKCCSRTEYVERAVEHLRKQDRREKFAVCEECADRQEFVPLASLKITAREASPP